MRRQRVHSAAKETALTSTLSLRLPAPEGSRGGSHVSLPSLWTWPVSPRPRLTMRGTPTIIGSLGLVESVCYAPPLCLETCRVLGKASLFDPFWIFLRMVDAIADGITCKFRLAGALDGGGWRGRNQATTRTYIRMYSVRGWPCMASAAALSFRKKPRARPLSRYRTVVDMERKRSHFPGISQRMDRAVAECSSAAVSISLLSVGKVR